MPIHRLDMTFALIVLYLLIGSILIAVFFSANHDTLAQSDTPTSRGTREDSFGRKVGQILTLRKIPI